MANRTALSRATDSSEAPTPGYLYLDIAKNAASSPVACNEVATYLCRRLATKNNPNIKFKCLKVISKTASSPVTRGQFKRAISQNAEAVSCIKDALNFRGHPDPARGDEPNNRVRVAAKEALDAVYSDTPSSSDLTSHNAGLSGGGGMSASYGNSAYSGGGGGGAPPPAAGRMEGIGNPMFNDPRNGAPDKNIGNMTIGQVVSVAGETLAGMIKDPLARNVPEQPPPGRSGMPGYGGGGYGAPPPGSANLARQTGGEWTMASNRGPNSVVPQAQSDSKSEYYKARDAGGANAYSWAQQDKSQSSMSGVGGSWGSVATAVPSTSSAKPSVASQARAPPLGGGFAPPTGAGGTAVSDGSYEKNLIMELCPPGGMKAEPPPDKLANFSRSVPSLNPDFVCPALLDALEDGQPWIIRAKALCVMEVTIVVMERHKTPDGYNPYADFFHACRAEIEPLASHARSAIRDPAKRVLKALGIESGVAAAPVAAPPQPPAPVPNLLDFDEPAAAAPPSSEPEAPPPAAPPAAASGGNGASLFGGMKVKAKEAPAATTPAESLLGDAPAPAPSAPAPAPTSGSLFGDVKVQDSSKAASEAEQVGKSAATTGSAFGFINKAAETQEEEPKKTKESFDPLLSGNGATQQQQHHPTMQLSTAQMQAMAYQQMMMQQQMQMQQMQIAYAMQQQPMGGAAATTPGGRPGVMNLGSSGAAASSSFSFLDVGAKPPAKEDKKFDFVKDALKNESSKK